MWRCGVIGSSGGVLRQRGKKSLPTGSAANFVSSLSLRQTPQANPIENCGFNRGIRVFDKAGLRSVWIELKFGCLCSNKKEV